MTQITPLSISSDQIIKLCELCKLLYPEYKHILIDLEDNITLTNNTEDNTNKKGLHWVEAVIHCISRLGGIKTDSHKQAKEYRVILLGFIYDNNRLHIVDRMWNEYHDTKRSKYASIASWRADHT